MKIITLNIWGGRVLEPLLEFFKTKAQEADIVCLQEVFASSTQLEAAEVCTNMLDRLLPIMEDYRFVYNSNVVDKLTSQISTPGLRYGNAIFARKSLKLRGSQNQFIVKYPGDEFDLEAGDDHPRALQIVQLTDEQGCDFSVANYHGYWSNGPKTDDAVRLEQSSRIRQVLDGLGEPFILCGDFNLLPTTKSLDALSNGLTDMVQRYELPSTRSSLYKRIEYAPFADYIFTSPEVRDKSFRALDEVVSDHLALELDFDLL
jgi:endonuclease/exonuclease/phosphatase family metal-dependent hydrolase